jgi:hypothetical protein
MKTTHGRMLAAAAAASIAFGTNTAMAQEDEWGFSVAPLYLWAKSVEAITTAGGQDTALELEFQDEILDNLEAAFAIHFEASRGNIALFAEYNYSNLTPSNKTSLGPIELRADVDFEETLAEGGMAWAFADSGSLRWEVLGGLRYYKQDTDIKIKSSREEQLLPERLSVGDRWVHPFAGGRVTASLSDRWSFRARADYGYEGSDNTALQGMAIFDYRFRDWGSAFFGYRYLDMDFDNGSSGRNQYGFDGDQQGPLIGLNLYF